MTTIFAVIGVLVSIPLAIMLRGWVLSVLWGWFMHPTLGLPILGVAQSIGIAMVVSMLTKNPEKYDPNDKRSGSEKIAETMMSAVMTPLIALLFGWIVKQFV